MIDTIKALRSAWVATLPEQRGRIEALWSESEEQAFQELRRMVHDLTLAGRWLGLGEVANAAEVVGLACERLAAGEKPDQVLKKAFDNLLAALDKGAKATLRGYKPVLPSEDGEAWIALFDPDDHFALDLIVSLGRSGFHTEVIADEASAHRDTPPKAVIFQVDRERAEQQGAQLAKLWPGVPTLALAEGAGFADRLAAVRAGAKAVFPIPIDFGQLTAGLGRWTRRRHGGNPYRVLVASGDGTVRDLLEEVLGGCGLEVSTVASAEAMQEPLRTDPPDLALVDRYLPECEDSNLAILIDQASLGTHILSLSAWDGATIPFMGGFQRLNVPTGLDQLAFGIEQAAARARTLVALQARDRLTGLLNREHVLELLESEIDRATRHQEPLSVAVIDLDRFKQINGLYGSAVGDQVLMALANMLRLRMRRSDLVGHCSGGSFMVVLPDTDSETAWRVMEGLRERFADTHHHSARGSFHASFSCGIAAFPQNLTPSELETAARGALDIAKHGGRDQVLIS